MRLVIVVAVMLTTPSLATAQLPFYTDDADVTPKGRTHFESFNEYDWLPDSQLPHLRQNTVNMKFNVGLGHGLELDLDAPLITIVNDETIVPRVPFGVGDTNFGIKWQMRERGQGFLGAGPRFGALHRDADWQRGDRARIGAGRYLGVRGCGEVADAQHRPELERRVSVHG